MRNATSIVEEISHWMHTVSLDDVPDAVVAEAKRCIIDLIGVTISAKNNLLIEKLRKYVNETYRTGPAHIIGCGDNTSPVGAALVNGTAGHVYDFDDTSYTGIMHGSTVAFPAALAAAEYADADGRRLLEAYIIGVEVTYAVALLCTTKHYFKGWWSTATIGAFGAAGAAAKAMELPRDKIANALALAGVQACGPKVIFGTDAKPYLAGRAAAIGVEAAQLSEKGLYGPTDIFEDDRGFINLMNDGIISSDRVDNLGRIWRLLDPGIFIKQYPVCSAAHAAVQLTDKLVRENDLQYNNIKKVICEIPPTVAISLVYNDPKTIQEAQFSMQFAVGCMLRYGKLNVTCLNNEKLNSQEMRNAMSRIEVKRRDSLHSDEAPECARINIILNNGHEVSDFLSEPYGMPNNRMDNESLFNKFHNCTGSVNVPYKESERLLQNLLQLDEIKSLEPCFSLESS